MSKLHQEMEQGAVAKRLLEEPMWEAAWTKLEEGAQYRWVNSDDAQTREECWFYLKVLKDLRREFEHTVRTGRLAQEQLKRERN